MPAARPALRWVCRAAAVTVVMAGGLLGVARPGSAGSEPPAPGFTGYFLSMNALHHSHDVWATAMDNRRGAAPHGEIVMRRHDRHWKQVAVSGLPAGGLNVDVVNGYGSAIWAGGYNSVTQRYYLARWHHGRFHQVQIPELQRTGEVEDISASGPNDVWAAGDLDSHAGRYEKPWFAHWDGDSWSRVPSPHFDVRHVDSVGPANAWALAADGTILHWDGTSWSIVRHPVGDHTQLRDLAASRAGRVIAVGEQRNPKTGWDHGIVLELVGGHWRQTSFRGQATVLDSVTVSGVRAWAVGSWIPPSKDDDTVILTSTGIGWHRQTSPVHGASALVSVSASSPHRAYAAGSYCPRETDQQCFTTAFAVFDGWHWSARSSRLG